MDDWRASSWADVAARRVEVARLPTAWLEDEKPRSIFICRWGCCSYLVRCMLL